MTRGKAGLWLVVSARSLAAMMAGGDGRQGVGWLTENEGKRRD